ncbi:hypothetical protein ABZV31_17995 [Streptomyces sp. NPDC005202]|uniref:hypothetical protein n=1 Tax=Streptomyces sp. NPDC005202 TaxID=3157021 RepID=UPI0033B79106
MKIRGRRLRFTAVLAIVVLTLTGFSRGHHGHSRHGGGGGGGGGCSSSRQDHDSSSSTSGGSYDSGSSDDDSYDDPYSSGGTYNRRPTYRSTPTASSGTGEGKGLEDGTARLVSCATKKKPYATVEVRNPNDRKATFSVTVYFMDEATVAVDDGSEEVSVPAKGRKTVKVTFDETYIDELDHCEVEPNASLAS